MAIGSTAELRKKVEEAFADTPRPDGRLVETTYDDEGVSEYFRGRTWRGHAVGDLCRRANALCFFTPEAFRYFLPAFMLASLEDSEEADVIPESIVFSFASAADPFWWERVKALSPAEVDAVEAFLWRLDFEGVGDGEIERALEALERARREHTKRTCRG